jgi:phospholipid/cholesterol/gamma-HCH transport system substrate-binding protein
METRAHYVLVGAITLGFFALAMVFSLWLARAQFNREYATYDIIFDGPVRGLQQGGEVRFNGIKVGEITDLALDPADPSKVVARIRVDAVTPVKVSTQAQLEALGLTGVNLIQLTAGNADDPRLTRKPGQRVPTIEAKKGALDDLVAAGKDIAQQANETLASIQLVLTPENVASVTRTVKNLETASAALAANDGALKRSAEAAAALREAAESVRKLADETNSKLSSTLSEANRAATAVADAAENARTFTASATLAADVAANQTLPDISTAARDLRRVAISLEGLANGVESGQTSLIGGNPARPTIKVRP